MFEKFGNEIFQVPPLGAPEIPTLGAPEIPIGISIEIFETFKDNWSWEHLSWNTTLPWSIEFIDRYKDRWNMDYFHQNEKIWEKAFADHVSGALIGEVMQRIVKNDRKKL